MPQSWGCNRRATTSQAKFGATLRAAVLFRPDFVARSLQIHCGICSSLAPRLAKKSLAAHVSIIKCHSTSHFSRYVFVGLLLQEMKGKPWTTQSWAGQIAITRGLI